MSDPYKGMTPDQARELLEYAMGHPSFSQALPVMDIRSCMLDAVHSKGENGTGGRPAYVKIEVDDGIVTALQGPANKSPMVMMLVAVLTQATERMESSIVLPGEPS